jgi:ABC-type glycerol-3-phosphate transport system permease component
MATLTTTTTAPRAQRAPFPTDKVFLYVGLIVAALFIGFPLFTLVAQSLMPNNEILTVPPRLFSPNPTGQHYNTLFSRGDLMLGQWLVNSLLVSTSVSLFSIALCWD